MKRISEIVRPFTLIVFGASLLLVYLNYLTPDDGVTLAIGITAITLGAYYLAVGILSVVIWDKLPSKLKFGFDVASVCLYPVFMFVYFLLRVIRLNSVMGPTAWVISIVGMVGSIALACSYFVAKVGKVKGFERFAFLFAAIFVLVLLLDVLFDVNGNTQVLGNIDIIKVVTYCVYAYYLINTFIAKTSEDSKEEAQVEDNDKGE